MGWNGDGEDGKANDVFMYVGRQRMTMQADSCLDRAFH